MRKLTTVCLFALLLPWAALADVYTYVDAEGVTHLTDTPPPASVNATRIEMWEDGGGDPTVIPLEPVQVKVDYSRIVEDACKYYKVDTALIYAMIKVESNFNQYAVSRVGARGYMQLMPATARRFNVNDPFHPVENIWAGVYYVKWLMVQFDYKYDLVIAAYNAGEGAVRKYKGIPPYRETQGYVKKVKYYWNIYKKQPPVFKIKPSAAPK